MHMKGNRRTQSLDDVLLHGSGFTCELERGR